MAGKSNKSKSKAKNGGTSKVAPADLAAGAVGLSSGKPETVDTEVKPSQNPEVSPKTKAAAPVVESSSDEAGVAKKSEDGEIQDGESAVLEGEGMKRFTLPYSYYRHSEWYKFCQGFITYRGVEEG